MRVRAEGQEKALRKTEESGSAGLAGKRCVHCNSNISIDRFRLMCASAPSCLAQRLMMCAVRVREFGCQIPVSRRAFSSSKSCFYEVKENVPPAFKQYKNQGNASNLVQSHFGSLPSFELESGITPLIPRGFDPACWGLYQPPPSPYSEQKNHFTIGRNSERCYSHTDLSRFVLPISDPSKLNE